MGDQVNAPKPRPVCIGCNGLGLALGRDDWGFGKPCPRCNGTGKEPKPWLT